MALAGSATLVPATVPLGLARVEKPLLIVGVMRGGRHLAARRDAADGLSDAPADGSLVVRFGSSARRGPYVARALQRELEVYNDVLDPAIPRLRTATNRWCPRPRPSRHMPIPHTHQRPTSCSATTTCWWTLKDYWRRCTGSPLLADSTLARSGPSTFGSRRCRNGRRRIGTICLEAVYPMSQLPPFAIGPHYLLSMDCAEFIHKKQR